MAKTVTVCSNCLRASCWHGAHYCEGHKGAGTSQLPVERLEQLGYESPHWWDVGDTQPDNQAEPVAGKWYMIHYNGQDCPAVWHQSMWEVSTLTSRSCIAVYPQKAQRYEPIVPPSWAKEQADAGSTV